MVGRVHHQVVIQTVVRQIVAERAARVIILRVHATLVILEQIQQIVVLLLGGKRRLGSVVVENTVGTVPCIAAEGQQVDCSVAVVVIPKDFTRVQIGIPEPCGFGEQRLRGHTFHDGHGVVVALDSVHTAVEVIVRHRRIGIHGLFAATPLIGESESQRLTYSRRQYGYRCRSQCRAVVGSRYGVGDGLITAGGEGQHQFGAVRYIVSVLYRPRMAVPFRQRRKGQHSRLVDIDGTAVKGKLNRQVRMCGSGLLRPSRTAVLCVDSLHCNMYRRGCVCA